MRVVKYKKQSAKARLLLEGNESVCGSSVWKQLARSSVWVPSNFTYSVTSFKQGVWLHDPLKSLPT